MVEPNFGRFSYSIKFMFTMIRKEVTFLDYFYVKA
jgi:hypothetical protein